MLRRSITTLALLAIIVVAIGVPDIALAQKRVALVVGNSAYQHTSALDNPKNDAADIAAALKQLGFDVFQGHDLTKPAMDRAIHNFAEALAGAQIAVFFYAGHGLQVAGQNYLVPIDAKLRSAASLDFEMVRLEVIQRAMERETTTNIIFLDACRDNPLARNLARALGTRAATVGRGLAAVESGEGTLISFSTQPGNVALDGDGRNSPFASALIKHIVSPGEDLPTILINVRNDVMEVTQRRQVPWEHSALTAKVYFTSPKAIGPTVDQQIELTFWSSVKDSTSPAVLSTYLKRYPDGEFSTIARALIEHYEQQGKVEQAKRVEEQKRLEEVRKAAEVRRLEEERRLREAALIEERKKNQTAKKADDAERLNEAQKAEVLARNEALQKAMDEEQQAKAAAKKAEKLRVETAKASAEATKAAEEVLAAKRDAVKTSEPAKMAALPKLGKVPEVIGHDGTWLISWRADEGKCTQKSSSYHLKIASGKISALGNTGTISKSGAARWTVTDKYGNPTSYSGTFGPKSGSGSFFISEKCTGRFAASRG